jgi:hypothetical protein
MQSTAPRTAFYAVGNADYFLGLVGLVNSLRLVGHREQIYVADCGFAESQRRRLTGHVTLVDPPRADSPHLQKTTAPLAHPADVMILIDADMIVVRRLDELVEQARRGKLVAFVDDVASRFDPRWSELLGLEPVRRHPYVNSGLVVLERATGIPLLERLAADCIRIDATRGFRGSGDPEYPFYYLDQDVLNAILATCEEERLDLRDHALAPIPPFRGLQILDEGSLRCSYDDGREPFVLHHVLRKPWLDATPWSIYSRLLTRLLLRPDVALPIRREDVPLRLRPGPAGWAEKRRSALQSTVRGVRGRLGLRRALRDKRLGSSSQGLDTCEPARPEAMLVRAASRSIESGE